MPTRRQRRVSELVHRELSMLLMFQARDPRLADVTITAVEVTPDLLQARIHYTVLGDAENLEIIQGDIVVILILCRKISGPIAYFCP